MRLAFFLLWERAGFAGVFIDESIKIEDNKHIGLLQRGRTTACQLPNEANTDCIGRVPENGRLEPPYNGRKKGDRPMAYYYCLLLDADNTLLDFDEAERKALNETFTQFELPVDAETVALYDRINKGLWAALDRGEMKAEKLAVERFSCLGKELNRPLDAQQMSRAYLEQLAQHGDTMPGALEALKELSEVATLAVVTNGFEKVQMNRLALSGLDRYLDGVFISEKVGATKPSKKIFDTALNTLGIEHRDRVLVVGDSLRTDVLGGNKLGLHTCWYNPNGQEPGDAQPTYTVTRLEELYPIVMEAEELANVGSKNRKHQL